MDFETFFKIIVLIVAAITGFLGLAKVILEIREKLRGDTTLSVLVTQRQFRFAVALIIFGIIAFAFWITISNGSELPNATATSTLALPDTNTPQPFTPTPTSIHTATSTSTITLSPTSTSTLTPTPTPTLIGGGRGQIAYAAFQGGNLEVFLLDIMNPSATPENLTNNFSSDSHPSWSPDGQKIAFVSTRDGNPEIYVMDANGSNQINISRNSNADYEPVWSPDGTKIAFTTYQYSGSREIAVMDTDGSNVQRLTTFPEYDTSPTWLSDGKTIIFSTIHSNPNGFTMYLLNIEDGSTPSPFTYRTIIDEFVSTSPSGNLLAFVSVQYGTYDLFTIQVDGYNLNRLTDSLEREFVPSWSPDGKHIVYVTDSLGISTIKIINIETKQITTIASARGSDHPVWRP